MSMPTIDVPVVLTKDQLREKEPYRGALNAATMHLNGVEYLPCHVVFQGFAGRGDASALFTGHYRFRPAQAADAERDAHDLRMLPGLPEVLVTTVESPPADVAEAPAVKATPEAVVEDAPKPRRRRKKHTEAD